MSFFGVTRETIKKILPHSNADRLEIALLKNISFQVVVGKGQFKAGDIAVYIPIDSLVPEETRDLLNLNFLQSNGKVRTIKLRGEYSQGILVEDKYPDEEDLTDFFKITKYEPSEDAESVLADDLMPLPCGLTAYSIKGTERHPTALEQVFATKVVIMEKMEGSNFSVTINYDGDIFVNSHNRSIKNKKSLFWKLAEETGGINLVRELAAELKGLRFNSITVYGEVCGPKIQRNIYKLKESTVYYYDIKYDNRFLDWPQAKKTFKDCGMHIVPIIQEDVLLDSLSSIKNISNGESALGDMLREGIIVKPMKEEFCRKLNSRLILKQRSPEYLANE